MVITAQAEELIENKQAYEKMSKAHNPEMLRSSGSRTAR